MTEEKRIEKLEKRIKKLEEKVFSSSGDIAVKKGGVRKFVERLDPQTHEERALYIAYFYEQEEGKNNFSMRDIEEGYRKCKIKKYSNMPMLAKRLHEKKEWIMPDGKEDDTSLWTLTSKGEKHVMKVLQNLREDNE